MALFKDRNFHKETINLDDNTFDECVIDDCTIVYSGGALPNLINSTFKNSNFVLDGAAQRTLIFMKMLNNSGAENVVEGMLEIVKGTIYQDRAK